MADDKQPDDWMIDVPVDANGWATVGPCMIEMGTAIGTIICVSHTVSQIMTALKSYDPFDKDSLWLQVTASADAEEEIGRRTTDIRLSDVCVVNYVDPEWVNEYETEV